MVSEFPERRESLWWVAAAPGIWGAHFVLAYSVAAVWCAKYAGPGGSLAPARLVIAALTLLALGGIAVVALRGVRQYRSGQRPPRTDADTGESRHQFLGFTLLSLSGLSALAVVYEALAAVFIGSCR